MQQPTQGMGTGAKIAIGGSIGCIGLVMVFVIAFIFIVIAGVVLLSIIGHQVNNVFSNIQTSVPQQPFPT